MRDDEIKTQAPQPKHPAANELGRQIGVWFAVNRGVHDQPAPLALANAVGHVLKVRLAQWLARKAAETRRANRN